IEVSSFSIRGASTRCRPPLHLALLLWSVLLEQFGELLTQHLDFRAVANLNVGILGIVIRVVLVIVLRAIESLEGRHLGYDRLWKDLLPIEFRNIRLCQTVLILVYVENRRPVRCPNVWPLAVQLRRVVCDREENAEQLPVGDA